MSTKNEVKSLLAEATHPVSTPVTSTPAKKSAVKKVTKPAVKAVARKVASPATKTVKKGASKAVTKKTVKPIVKKAVAKDAAQAVKKVATKAQKKIVTNVASRAAAKKATAKKVVSKKTAAKKSAAKPIIKAVSKLPAKSEVNASKAKAAGKPLIKARQVKPTALPKTKKSKLVRDSFTMPEIEYQVLSDVKKAFLKAGISVKKSELLRAGVAMVKTLNQSKLHAVISALSPIKAGRPKNDR